MDLRLQWPSWTTPATVALPAAAAAFSQSPDATLLVDAEGRIAFANPAAALLLGRSATQVVGKALLSCVHPVDRPAVAPFLLRDWNGATQRVEIRLVSANGAECIAVASVGRITDAEGIAPPTTIFTLRDVTEERQAREDLRRSEKRYRHLFEGASNAIMTFDSLGRFTTVNDAGELISGYRRDELIGRFFAPLLALEALPKAVLEFRRALSGSPGEFETILVRKDGQRRNITVNYSCPQRSHEVLCMIRDATEEKQMQQQLIQSEKMAAIGQLVSGVAHELNNPLASISAFAQLLLGHSGITGDQRHSAEVINEEARRAARIVHNLLTFARQHPAEKTYADVNKIIDDTLELRTYELNVRGIRIARDFEDVTAQTMADVYQVQQVILNLITNAEHAMKMVDRPYHRLTLRTRTLERVIRIDVEDTGTGLPPDSLELIFNPFYTTKPTGEGTGLGLSISLGIVGEHGGRIWAENVPSGGSRFCVELPKVSPEFPVVGSIARQAPAPASGLRILVADDEPHIRTALELFLTSQGHDVVSVGSGTEVFERVREGPTFDVILLDIRMPDVSGKQVFEQWQRERDVLADSVVFITGDIVSPDLQSFLAATARPYLSKPFEFEAILGVLPSRAAA